MIQVAETVSIVEELSIIELISIAGFKMVVSSVFSDKVLLVVTTVLSLDAVLFIWGL